MLARLLNEISDYSIPDGPKSHQRLIAGDYADLVVPLQLVMEGGVLSLFSMTTVFGTPAWTSADLRSVVERRIEWNLGKQGVRSSSLSNIFIQPSEAKVSEFFERLLSMAVNGPRNAIDLFKRCIDRAAQGGRKQISSDDIDNVAFQYGNDVITSLSSF